MSENRQNCPVCGGEIEQPAKGRPRVYCSRKCRNASRTAKPPTPEPGCAVEHTAEALARWSRDVLKVPPGHALAREPLTLPDYGVAFIRDALTHRESLLAVGRKNAKSAVVAVYLLGRLVGPLRFEGGGYRGGVCSVNRDKAAELWLQCEAIAKASGLAGIRFGKVPRCMVSAAGEVAFLSADKSAGHAAGFDDAICDELGLFVERDRALVNGMRSALGARNGRFIALSILGDAPFTRELLERKAEPDVAVHLYQAPANARLEDVNAWHAANPGLAVGIKSMDYMRAEARRALATPADQAFFRAHDLNQPGNPEAQPIVSLDTFNLCAERGKAERAGRCFVGFDMGGSSSMCAAAAYWPETGRLDVWGGFGDMPDLEARGEADGVGRRYVAMRDAGELRVWPGRVTPVSEFLAWVAEHLEGEEVELAAADRYRQAEAEDALEAAGVDWMMEWRAQGAGKDGSADVRAFQRAIEGGALRPGESLLLRSAVAESVLRFDGNGNPALEKGRQKGRIDALASAVLAVGLGSRATSDTDEEWFFHAPLDGGEITAAGG